MSAKRNNPNHAKVFYPKNSSFQGGWLDDLKSGFGIYNSKNAIYEGSWLKGKRHGHGVLYHRDSGNFKRVYEGDWFCGFKHGQGTSREHGNLYIGKFEKNVKCGSGQQKFHDGSVYVGNFSNNLPNGQGRLTHANGNIYDGGFANGVCEGKGILIFKSSGMTLRGVWHKGQCVTGTMEGSNIPDIGLSDLNKVVGESRAAVKTRV